MVADLFDYRGIDPDGAYGWISVHHIVQTIIFLTLMVPLSRFKSLEFGFGWGNKEVGK